MHKIYKKEAADRNRTIYLLIIQAVIMVSTAITAVLGFLNGAGERQDGDHMIGMGYFKAFTMDSNVLAGICAFIIVCFAVRNLLKKEDTMPDWVIIFQYMSATSLFLTIVTVVFFLAPSDVMEGKSYLGMFSNDLFVFHLINPLLAIFSFVCLQKKCRWKRTDCLWGLLPMVVYAVVYFMMVVVLKKWNDFYGFSFDGRYYLIPVVVIVICLLTYFLGWLLLWMNEKQVS